MSRGLIEVLEHLRIQLASSWLHHAFYMKYNSEHKEQCPYYKKSMYLLEKENLDGLRAIINELNPLLDSYQNQFYRGEENNGNKQDAEYV